jgi:hypothetical protein
MNVPVFLVQQQVSRRAPQPGPAPGYVGASGLIGWAILLLSVGSSWCAAAVFDLSAWSAVIVFTGVYLILTLAYVIVFVCQVASEMKRNRRDRERYELNCPPKSDS